MRDFWLAVRGYPLRAFVICWIAYTFSQMDQALFSYAVPSIREEFGVSLTVMGWVIAGSFVLAGIVLVLLARIADRIGRKSMLQFSIVISSLFIAAHALAPTLLILGLLRGFGVATTGLLYPVTGAIVAEESPARYRGLMAGLMQTGYPMGWFLASLFAAEVLATWGWRPLFLVGLLSIPYVFVASRTLRESLRFTEARAAAGGAATRSGISALFAPDMRRRTLVLFFAQYLFVIAYGGSAIWFPTYFVEARGIDIGSSSYLVGIGNAIGILGYVLAALAGEFLLTRRTTVVVWTLLGNLAFLYLIWGTETTLEAVVAFGVMSMFFYGTAAVKFAFVAEIFPTALRATGIAVCGSLAVTLGIATGPLLVTYAVERFGWDIAFSLVVAGPLFVAGFLYLLLKPVPSGLEVEEVQSYLAAGKDGSRDGAAARAGGEA
jgi:putative MFS transporter